MLDVALPLAKAGAAGTASSLSSGASTAASSATSAALATQSWTVGTAGPAVGLFTAQMVALIKAWSLGAASSGAGAVAAFGEAFSVGCALLGSWTQALIEQASSLGGMTFEKLQLNQRLGALIAKLQTMMLQVRPA